MPLSWSDAVEHTAASDAAGRYRRAHLQILELHTMVMSFRRAVVEADKWPNYNSGDSDYFTWSKNPYLETAKDTHRAGVRYLRLGRHDDSWALRDVIPELDDHAMQIAEVDGSGAVDLGGNLANVLTLTDFDLRMDAIERSKDWVPLQLLGYLQTNDIPVPAD